MTRTYWLSFCDTDAPTGEQFKGVCIVDVDQGERETAEVLVLMKYGERDDEVYWLAAAVTKSHEMGCNPGGEVASMRIDEAYDALPEDRRPECPRNRLLLKPELEALGHL